MAMAFLLNRHSQSAFFRTYRANSRPLRYLGVSDVIPANLLLTVFCTVDCHLSHHFYDIQEIPHRSCVIIAIIAMGIMFYLPRSIFDKLKLGLKYYQLGTREIEDGRREKSQVSKSKSKSKYMMHVKLGANTVSLTNRA